MNAALPIFTFHCIDGERDVLAFAPHSFEQRIADLPRWGYTTMRLSDAVDGLMRGTLAPKVCVITFDDGYRSVYENALPILQRYRMTATIFLTTGVEHAERLPALNGRALLSWSEIQEMHSYGIEFGAHTLTHPDLTRLSPDKIEIELSESKKLIEQAIGARVATFAYPFGKFNTVCRDIARRHFDCAVSDRLGLAHARSEPHALERVEMYYFRDARLFNLLPTRWFAWYLRARQLPRQLRRAFRP